jgi:hypothetical protein
VTSLAVFVVAVMSYRSQPDVTGADTMMEAAGSLECHRETAAYSKSAHNSLSDLTGKTGSLRCINEYMCRCTSQCPFTGELSQLSEHTRHHLYLLSSYSRDSPHNAHAD